MIVNPVGNYNKNNNNMSVSIASSWARKDNPSFTRSRQFVQDGHSQFGKSPILLVSG